MKMNNNFLRRIISILTIICFIFTIIVGSFVAANFREIFRMLEVGLFIKTQYLEEVTTQKLLEGAVRGMVDSLGDPYSVFMDKKEYSDMHRYIQGSIGGIGIYVGLKDKKIIVVAPIEGSPAYKAGIQREDVIIKIDDRFASDLNYDEAVNLMRGEPGTQVNISIMREGVSKLLDFTFTREAIDIPTVESDVLKENKNIGYMRLRMFASNTDESVRQQLEELKARGIKGLIVDLRDNPGGDLESAVNIAGVFVSEGPVVYTVDRNQNVQSYGSEEGGGFDKPLVVLINGGSASASEVLSGAIKDTKTGTLIGEKTFGKGIVQAIFPLGGGDGLKLTTSKYLTPNKIDIHNKGIEPDIEVVLTQQDKEDLQLKEAVKILENSIK